jgi:hypothetical protein
MKRLFPASLVFELFCLVLLSSSLDMMVDCQTLIVAHRLQIYRIMEFHLLRTLLAIVLSTCRGFLILKVDCRC